MARLEPQTRPALVDSVSFGDGFAEGDRPARFGSRFIIHHEMARTNQIDKGTDHRLRKI